MSDPLYGNGMAPVGLTTPTRNRYFYGKLMDVFHFNLEQTYHLHARWAHDRLTLGQGVLCGLTVAPSADGTRIGVGPGAAVDEAGRTIFVPAPTPVIDPRQLTDAFGRPTGTRVDDEGDVTLALAYYECEAEPVPVLISAGCDGAQPAEPSVIRERYALVVTNGAPPAITPACDMPGLFASLGRPAFYAQLADRVSQTCADSSPTPCVVLAHIRLPAAGLPITSDLIDPTVRPVVFSNPLLFDLLVCLAATPSLVVQAGDNQTALPTTATPAPLTVQVLQHTTPVAGLAVTFQVVAGDGAVGLDSANPAAVADHVEVTTDADGLATLPLWLLGPNVGANLVRASLTQGWPAVVYFHATGITAAAAPAPDLPVVQAFWPPNGLTLAPPAAWDSSWKGAPRVEITFSREIAADSLAQVDSWLRVWQIQARGPGDVLIHRVQVQASGQPDTAMLRSAGVTESFALSDVLDLQQNELRWRFLVQVRAVNDILLDTSNQALDADFQGTQLTAGLLDAVWALAGDDVSPLGDQVWAGLADSFVRVPHSGDGQAGGLWHSCFEIVPG
jgi:hypothetical protein